MNSSQYNQTSDNELLDHFYNDRDNEWLGMLLQRYTLLLLGVCMKYLRNEEEAKDCVQQVFLKAIGEMQKYEVRYFKSWIYMIAKNACLMKLRNKARFTTAIDDRIISSADEINENTDRAETDRKLGSLEEALRRLNNEQQRCVILFYFEKKSYQEIADQTHYSLMQVKSHIQNGKRNLKIMMEKDG